MIKQFEVGKTYSMRSPCQHDCIWTYKVTARTAQTVTLTESRGEKVKCRISKAMSAYRQAETVFPLGRYSMCPMLSAE